MRILPRSRPTRAMLDARLAYAHDAYARLHEGYEAACNERDTLSAELTRVHAQIDRARKALKEAQA